MLQLEELRVSYGRSPALRGIDLRIEAGEVVGLVGSNGAGKSTTLLAIAGALRPAGGRISFQGKPLDGLGPERVARRGIRLVPEGRHVFAQLTVEENLRLGATGRRDRAAIERDVRREFERFPVLERLRRTGAGKLSGGEQQQLVISRALLARPSLILLDEPSLGLAPLVVDRVFEAIDGLREAGMTVLLVEQMADRAMAHADRTYVLQGGLVRAHGTSEHLRTTVDLESAYLGRTTA